MGSCLRFMVIVHMMNETQKDNTQFRQICSLMLRPLLSCPFVCLCWFFNSDKYKMCIFCWLGIDLHHVSVW